MLSVYQLSHYNNIRSLYQDLSFEVHPGEIIGIVGPNGAGKSTLLKAIASQNKGISLNKNQTISFLSQVNDDENQTVLQAALYYQPHLRDVINDIDLYTSQGGFFLEHKLQQELSDIYLDSPMKEYSLGQRQWIRLISLLQSPSEILLLDEPTNYLDLEHIHLFKQKLLRVKHKKAVLLVTHDRYLLDELVDKTLYLGPEGCELVDGGYTSFIHHQEHQRISKVNLSNKLKKQITHLSEESTRKKVWAGRAEKEKKGALDKGFMSAKAARLAKKAVQAEQKRSQQIEKLKQAQPVIKKKLNLENKEYTVRLKEAVIVNHLSKRYTKPLFTNLSFSLHTRDRVALCGPNGCGKSSLIRCLVGLDKDYSGNIQWNPYIKWHYLPQGLENYFEGNSLAEHFSILNIDLDLVRRRLGNMLLRNSIWEQHIQDLSSGEKMRVALVEAMILQSEFLILDEPTNHLDIESLEILDKLLDSFPGGFLFVSHDQIFLERHANSIFYINSEGVNSTC